MTLSDVELGHHVHERAEPCLSVPGSRAYLPSSTARGRETLGAGACRDRPEPTTGLHDKRPLFAVILSVGGIAVFRVLGGDVAPPCERNKKKGSWSEPILTFMYQKRRKRRRAAVGGSAWAGSRGRRDQGSSTRSQAGGFVQAFVLPSQRRWLPISYTGRAQMVRTGAATAPREGR